VTGILGWGDGGFTVLNVGAATVGLFQGLRMQSELGRGNYLIFST